VNTCRGNNCKCIRLIAEHYSEKQQEVRRKKKRGFSVLASQQQRGRKVGAKLVQLKK